ncbi:hypothetical protein NHP21011_12730 [Helicobacter heilmannii]|nr:hypothetical protein NHP21011_12730 [Helicobacter heilmannii]
MAKLQLLDEVHVRFFRDLLGVHPRGGGGVVSKGKDLEFLVFGGMAEVAGVQWGVVFKILARDFKALV